MIAIALLSLLAGVAGAAPEGDRIEVVVPAESQELLAKGPASGRLKLFLNATHSKNRADPADGPFFEDPQPIYSVPVQSLKAGQPIVIDASATGWPVPIDQLSGEYELQAVFDNHHAERGHHSPGNLFSKPVTMTFDPHSRDTRVIELTEVVPDIALPKHDNVVWIDEISPMLTQATGRPTRHRAAVVLPHGYNNINFPRRVWPTIYVVPGFGGRFVDVDACVRMLGASNTGGVPQAVWVILDPESPLGHHAFADSKLNGPRGAALVKELIPLLEERFRLIRDPQARLLTGHSSGGWSTLWLQLTHPEAFGGCWSSSPDPVDFTCFQLSDMYHDENMFTDAQGKPQGSYRRPIGPNDDQVLMTVQQEVGMERALDPEGGSGEQWDSWNACFGAPGIRQDLPRNAFDPVTGRIDHEVIEKYWSPYDIARMVAKRWKELAPVFADKVHLLVGSRDSFYLERAVEKLRKQVAALQEADVRAGAAPPAGGGFIEIIPGATHDTAAVIARGRFALSMRDYLKKHGFSE
ncbi:MAG: hypothetical protein K8R92_06285 [Planctomycetes bacterium]|nr:hypothetical protein [Planctomycetota bacterium]